MIYWIIISSMLFQIAAAILALRLIPETGRRWSWILLSLGLAGMVLRRAHILLLIAQGGYSANIPYELIGLGISVAVFAGVASIRPLFKKLRVATDELAASEQRFRTMADFTYDWEYWRGPDGAFLYMSPSCKLTTGYSQEEFMADPALMRRIIHPDDKEDVLDHLAAEAQTKQLGELDFRIIASDGGVVWISHHCTPVFGANNEYLGVRASNRNITRRKKTEASLEQSRRLYHDLVEQAQSIIMELDTSGKVIFLNGFGQSFFGYSSDEIYGVGVLGTLLPENCTAIMDVHPTESSTDFDECEVQRKDGSRASINWVRSVLYDQRDQPRSILCVGLDNTTKKAAEKLKDDVERIVRHDMKSPLMGIIGLPHLLLRDDNLTADQREMLVALEGAGKHLLQLINQSLNLYKLESGTYAYHPESVDLLAIVAQSVRDQQAQISEQSDVEVLVEGASMAEGKQVLVPGDETLLYCMVGNLLKNALEAGDDAPVVIAIQPGDPCVLEVRNRQPVPPEVRDHFFEKYATHGKKGGTGLGTYSALLAVRAHGGRISMLSSESTGTTVRVELPCPQEAGHG